LLVQNCKKKLQKYTRECEEYEFKCGNNVCTYESNVCDGYDRCGDNSDEKDCETRPCEADYKKCDNKISCVPSNSFCDRTLNCVYGSDEKNCAGVR
jgi:low density lipoprotein-related protein 2